MANYQLEQTGAEVQAILNAVESPDTTPAAGSSNLITSGAVQAAVAGVSAEVTALGQEVNGVEDWADVDLALETPYYYQYLAATNRIKVAPQALSASACTRISVNPGDKFKIFGADNPEGQSVTRLWSFSDGTIVTDGGVDYYSVLEVADDKINTRGTGAVITAPQGAVYLTICFQSYDATQDKLQKWQKVDNGLVGDIAEIREDVTNAFGQIQDINNKIDAIKQQISVQKTTTANRIKVWIDKAQNINAPQYELKVEFVHPNGLTQFTLFKATTAFSGLVNLGTFQVGKTISIEKDAEKPVLYVYYSAYEDEAVSEYVVNAVMTVYNEDSIEYKVDKLAKDTLAEKNIVLFGDSLSEFKGNTGKSWPDYFVDITGANIVNVAIGGSQLRQRRALIKLFKETSQINTGDWVYYKPSGSLTMNCYQCINAHLGAWNANDFEEVTYNSLVYATLDIVNMVAACCDTSTPISARFENQVAAAQCIADHFNDDNTGIVAQLPDIDWSIIDSVIILGGTNDYGNASNMGESGSTDINKTLGAINAIVQALCSTYKKVALYYVTPVVHWADYEGGADPAKWCDVYAPASMGMTRKEYYSDLLEEFANNHIPGLDLYNELGWNIDNFSAYFNSNDGTHPRKGFYQMARKISAYIEANRTF